MDSMCMGILMMSNKSWKTMRLMFLSTNLFKQISTKDAVVTMNVLDLSIAYISKPFFKASLGHDSFTSTKVGLSLSLNSTATLLKMVLPWKLIVITFLSITCWNSSKSADNKLIHWDKVISSVLFTGWNTFLIFNHLLLHNSSIRLLGIGEFTRHTLVKNSFK